MSQEWPCSYLNGLLNAVYTIHISEIKKKIQISFFLIKKKKNK